MRDTTVSDEDLAIQLAKERLLQLAARPGYEAAMHPTSSRSRTGQLVSTIIAVAFIALTVGVWTGVGALWLRIPLVVVLGAIDVFALLMIIGTAPSAPPAAWAAAVLAKPEPTADKPDDRSLTILRADGETLTIVTTESIYTTLRPGDVGVAHVLGVAPSLTLTAFHRL